MLDKKLSILVDVFGEYKKEGNQYLFFCVFCPELHHKPKLSVNIEKNKYKCWVCNKAGSDIGKLIKEAGNSQQIREWNKLTNVVDFSEIELKYLFQITNENNVIRKEALTLPAEFRTLVSEKLSEEGKIAKNYLFKRGLSLKDIYQYKIGYCSKGEFGNRIIIPSFDNEGHLNYFIARSYREDKKKYMYPIGIKHSQIIVNELYIDFHKTLIIVEGIFDALKAGNQAIPLLGSELSVGSKLFQTIIKHNSKVTLSLDNDAKDKEMKIAKSLLSYGIFVNRILIPDEFKDIGEMSREQFEEAKVNSTFPLTSESIMCYNLARV